MAKRTEPHVKPHVYPLISPKERLAIWEKARGLWKRRKPDPVRELKKMRQGRLETALNEEESRDRKSIGS